MNSKVTSTLMCAMTGAVALGALSSCKTKKGDEAPKKPMNIVYIMCDDHSTSDSLRLLTSTVSPMKALVLRIVLWLIHSADQAVPVC